MNALTNGKYQRRTAAEWQEILDRFRRSGKTPRQFCKQESIGEASLHRWRQKLETESKTEFVEVAQPTDTLPAFWSVEIELPDGRMLRIRG